MKIFVVLLALPVITLCQEFRQPPNCLGDEESMPKQAKCVSTQTNCGGGNYANGVCSCKTGYMRAGSTGKICIPQCTGTTLNCVSAGGSCTAPNFCSCGPGRAFSNGQCLNTNNCGGQCYLGTCTSGTCVCPQDYKLNANGTNCEPIGDCPYYSVVTLPNLCQCIGTSFYLSGACKNAPPPPTTSTTEKVTTSTTPQTTSTTTEEVTTSTTPQTTSTTTEEITTSSTVTTTEEVTTSSTTSEVTTTESTTESTESTTESTESTTESTESTTESTESTTESTTEISSSSSESTPFLNTTSTMAPECSCGEIESFMQQIMDELNKLENGF